MISAAQKKIALQFLKEFWIPAVVATIWAFASTRSEPAPIKWIGAFSGSFFLASWLLGQVFRIAKQVRTESSLSAIASRLEDVVDGLERSVQQQENWVTGGDSYCFLQPMAPRDGALRGIIQNPGKYSLQDITARVVNIRRLAGAGELTQEFLNTIETTVPIGDIHGGRGGFFNLPLPAFTDDYEAYNVFFTARNGSWVQMLRLLNTEDGWKIATRVIRDQGDVRQELQLQTEGYPRDPEWE